MPVPEKGSSHMKLMCKAVDANYNAQPESPDPIWNLRGVLNNAWHQVSLEVQ